MFGSTARGVSLFGILALIATACVEPEPALRFVSGEVLSHPGTTSVELSLIPAEPAELFVEYGPVGDDGLQPTTPTTVAAEATGLVQLDGLRPGTRYRYRVRSRREGSSSVFDTRPEKTSWRSRVTKPTP